MSAAPGPKPSFGRHPLWALMAAPVAVGILLALGRWLGRNRDALDLAMSAPHALPTEWALVSVVLVLALMAATAARKGCLRSLLRSYESPVWYGGVLILTAGFFRCTYGPWGMGLSLYGLITWNLSPSGLPILLVAWPMAYGAVVVATSYATVVSGRPSTYRWRWAVVGLFLAVIATALLVITLWADAGLDRTTRVVFLGTTSLVLAALAVTIGCAPGDRRKAHLMDLISALWLLPALDPRGTINGHAIPLSNSLRGAGPGYWLQALGTVSILLGALGLLVSSRLRDLDQRVVRATRQ
jgi:hypothetical protein